MDQQNGQHEQALLKYKLVSGSYWHRAREIFICNASLLRIHAEASVYRKTKKIEVVNYTRMLNLVAMNQCLDFAL